MSLQIIEAGLLLAGSTLIYVCYYMTWSTPPARSRLSHAIRSDECLVPEKQADTIERSRQIHEDEAYLLNFIKNREKGELNWDRLNIDYSEARAEARVKVSKGNRLNPYKVLVDECLRYL